MSTKVLVKEVPFLRSAFNYDTAVASDDTGLFCPAEEDVTQQQFKDECDINVILDRFGITGEMPEPGSLVFGDFTDVSDFRSAMEAVRTASETFMTVPAKIRAKFAHDPQAFIQFFNDEKNEEEARLMGLLPPKPVVSAAPAAAPAAAAAPSGAAPAASGPGST